MSDNGQAIDKVGYSHDKIIDVLVAQPRVKLAELSALFGYSVPWLSRVMSSDAFRARLAERRVELVDPAIVASLEERFRGVVQRGLEVLQEKLDAPAVAVDGEFARKAVETAARGLAIGGFGAKPATNVNVHVDLADAVAAGNARRQALYATYEGVAVEVPGGSTS